MDSLLLALLIGVAGRHRQEGPISVEGQGGNGRGVALVLVEALLVLAVPNIDDAIAAAGGKGAVRGVEGDCVYRVDCVLAVLLSPVALTAGKKPDKSAGILSMIRCLCFRVIACQDSPSRGRLFAMNERPCMKF
eukprot:scaffold347237_cov42-Prasinocladus_malaysianus.AAC.1